MEASEIRDREEEECRDVQAEAGGGEEKKMAIWWRQKLELGAASMQPFGRREKTASWAGPVLREEQKEVEILLL